MTDASQAVTGATSIASDQTGAIRKSSQRTHTRQFNRLADDQLPLSDARDHTLNIRFRVGLTGQQVTGELRILQIEEPLERPNISGAGRGAVSLEPTLEEHIEFLHAASATPTQPTDLAQACSRSAIMTLISAMALAGLRSFGQASVQFMIVWHRYSRNGSSSASSRSPVASSRLSMIQR